MKKLLSFLLILFILLPIAAYCSVQMPEVEWTYPVSLTDIQSDYLLLVNEDHLLDSSFSPSPLVKVSGIRKATSSSMQLQEDCLEALKLMFEGAASVQSYTYTTSKGAEKNVTYKEGTGMVLYVKSAYRTYGTQKTMYANRLAANHNYDDGYVAKPGSSEHQTGLCADVVNAEYTADKMNQGFKWTAEAQWMKEHCWEYGFILRYPEDKEDVTRIKFEPWHFRYVGIDAAAYIMKNGLCLEEFTLEAEAALEDFLARGGDVQEQLDYEYRRDNSLPFGYALDPDEEDPEIAFVF